MKLAQELHKTEGEILDMPASEFEAWTAFFEIYPFTVERQDRQFAMIAAVISNMSGKQMRRIVGHESFMPHYEKRAAKQHAIDRPIFVHKSLEQQRQEWDAFKMKLQSVQRRRRK